ncbi:hypothetical protein D3C80_1031930 [compost metagenome]
MKNLNDEDDVILTNNQAVINPCLTVSEILLRHNSLCMAYEAALKRVVDNPRSDQVKNELRIAAKNLENYVSKKYVPM